MPKLGTYGSVRGALSNGCLYRDCGGVGGVRLTSHCFPDQPGDALCYVSPARCAVSSLILSQSPSPA